MRYHHIKNSFFNSNTFIVENKSKQIVIIDPGSPDISKLLSLINKNNWSIEAIILTHEHVDHIAGLPIIQKLKKTPVFCSKSTSVNIRSSKHNLSKYIDKIDTFEIDIETEVLNDNAIFTIADLDFFFMETPGHSPGGSCVFTSDAVFTGDTILGNMKTPNTKVPLNYPHSNRILYDMSIEKIKNKIKPGMIIFPGHGKPFKYYSRNQPIFSTLFKKYGTYKSIRISMDGKGVQPTIFGSNASGRPSNTTSFISILAIQVLNYLKEFRRISSIITRKNIKALG